jgi:DNA-binding MurR/RpiR family transcriptional regulator
MPDLVDRQSLTALLHTELPRLSGAQRQLALYLLTYPDQVPFMTATDLARAAGTSQSSVTRFVTRLRFESYADFTSTLSRILINELHPHTPPERFEQTRGQTPFTDLLEMEINHLRDLSKLLHAAEFKRSVEMLASSGRVIVAGFAASASLAEHVYLYMSRLRQNTTCVTSLGASLITQLMHWNERDCVLLFAAPRTTNEAVLLLHLLQKQQVPVVLVTDPLSLSALTGADETLVVPVTLGPTTAMPVAMLALGSILVDAVALEHPEHTVETLRRFEVLSESGRLFAKSNGERQPYWEQKMKNYT